MNITEDGGVVKQVITEGDGDKPSTPIICSRMWSIHSHHAKLI